ncbi:ATP-grasp domain-containing protein [Pantoea vagans]|uniref:ATP-grasp domain-containing protein n=1 Tax=Pantoea vagans TaxID=470934 RepID=UPI003513F093
MNTTINGNKSILVIEPIGMGGELLLKAIRALDYHSVVATTEEVYTSMLQEVSGMIDDLIFLDFSVRQQAIETLVSEANKKGVSGVVVAWEFLTDIAAEVAQRLNLCGPDASLSRARRNKYDMYRTLSKAECPLPALLAVLTDKDDVHQLPLEELAFPLVVKPAENAASFGVSVLMESEEFPQACKDASQWTHEYPHGIPFSKEILVQEYIPGQEFSVEGLSVSGRYAPWGVTMKFTTPGKARAETGHIFPAPVPDALRDEILNVAAQAVIALGITNGISHTEIKLDKEGKPRVIESCSRPAGDYIPRLVALSTDQDPLEIYARQAVGRLDSDFKPAAPKRYCAIQFIRPEAEGVLKQLEIPSRLENASVIETRSTVSENSPVKPGSTNIERLGWAIFTADSEQSILSAMDEFSQSTKVSIV